jgi:archaellin
MQEDIENRTIALVISSGRLTGRMLQSAIRQLLHEFERRSANKEPEIPHGKQSVKQLIGQNAGASNIEINDSNIRVFEKIARKYGVDYALRKDKTSKKPRWLVFFKARDADALTAAFTEFTAKVIKPEKKPSILKQLTMYKEKLKAQAIDRMKKKDREITR